MITIREYSLPFKQPFVTASGTYSARNGLVFTFSGKNTGTFSAEAAPLPGFSPDHFSGVKSAAEAATREFYSLLKREPGVHDLQHFLDTLAAFPSLQFALSGIGLFYLAGNKTLPSWAAAATKKPGKILINDVIGILPEQKFHNSISNSLNHGFRTLKIKCPYPFGYLPDVLRFYSKKFPDMRIRLDANQSWPEKALDEFHTVFSQVPVEYIEEPCQNTRSISQKYNHLPVALDESLHGIDSLEAALSDFPDQYIVIKPALFGNIFKLAETIIQYRSMRNRMVFSTMLEAAAGRSFILFLASALGDHEIAHGINTGKFFKKDLYRPFKPAAEMFSEALFQKNSNHQLPDNQYIKTLFTIY